MKIKYWLLSSLLITLSGPLLVWMTKDVNLSTPWYNASRRSADIAPNPEKFKPALIQLYCARAHNWRGLVSTHCWLSLKQENARHFTSYQVTAWGLWSGKKSSVHVYQGKPDRYWFEHKPTLVQQVSGKKAQQMIPLIEETIKEYPYKKKYVPWPGPNSNSFIAYIGRSIPQLKLHVPANAIGRNFLISAHFFAPTPDHFGYQCALRGLFGLSISKRSGIQITFLGLNYGISFHPFGLVWSSLGLIPFWR